MSDETDDVVVIGGGAAGLSGALALGRSRRSVLVLDAGEPRNAPAAGVHNYLGREGTPPGELLAVGRAEVEAYGVRVVDARVVAVRPWGREGTGFTVETAAGDVHTARRVLVATGARDVLPDLPGLAERWGHEVLHCPYCHGYEVRDRAVAVLATSPMAAHQALLFRQLTDDVVVVGVVGGAAPGDLLAAEDLERLHARGVEVRDDPATEAVLDDGRLTGLRLASGAVLERDAVVVATRVEAGAEFLAPLGLSPEPVEMRGTAVGRALAADAVGATAVPGVFVAGNASDLTAQVLPAAATGLRVGAWINAELATAEADAAVEHRHAEVAGFFDAEAWEERYGGQSLWSGRVNPQLAAEAADLPPGRALDIGCGEGGDAIWLAARGWQVTGLDFARTGLDRAAAHATEAGVADRCTWRQDDARTFDAAGETWDLVTAQYFHQPDGGMVDVTRRLGGAVAAGGVLLVVGHHADDLHTGLRGGRAELVFTPDDLRPALDPSRWTIEVAEVRDREAHGHDGPVTVRDSVLRARRRA